MKKNQLIMEQISKTFLKFVPSPGERGGDIEESDEALTRL